LETTSQGIHEATREQGRTHEDKFGDITHVTRLLGNKKTVRMCEARQ